jgi:CRISPR-associated protein Cas1
MQHLSIAGYGVRLGLKSNRLIVHGPDDFKEYPLKNLKTITLLKEGLSLSSDLLLACSSRGIRVFLADFKGEIICSLSGASDHAVAGTRRLQFMKCQTVDGFNISKRIISAKIANQRAVLLYFSKSRSESKTQLNQLGDLLSNLSDNANSLQFTENWRETLMGIEGTAAKSYFEGSRQAGLTSSTFTVREGRGSSEIMNAGLNYGYAILQTAIWTAILAAGLEPWMGFLHTARPGKPSLVLDLMEEYRPWVVDRNIFKLRPLFEGQKEFSPDLRKRIINEVRSTLENIYPYRGKRVRLEVIIQRQIYRLIGELSGGTNWTPYRFKW